MELSIFDQAEQVSQESIAPDAASLYWAFEQVKDGRRKKGKRYPLALILTLIMLGKLAGETTIEGIIDWIDERKKEIQQLFNWPKRFPAHKTYRCALAKCDHQEIGKAIAQVILKARAAEQGDDHPSRRLSAQGESSEKLTHNEALLSHPREASQLQLCKLSR